MERRKPMTPELLLTIKKLWTAGVPARQIAEDLGDGLAPADVIEAVSRPANIIRKKQCLQEVAAPTVAPVAPPVAPIAPSVAPPDEEVIETFLPVEQRCTLFDLTERRCKWPVGDPTSPDFFFCGARKVADSPYCGYHLGIAYRQ